MYKVYVWDMGKFRESHTIPVEYITKEEAKEVLNANGHILIGDNGDHIQAYNINGKWYTLIVNKENVIDVQLKRICEELKEDIVVKTVSGASYNYRYDKTFEKAM